MHYTKRESAAIQGRRVPPPVSETPVCICAATGRLSIWSRLNWAGERWPCRSISQSSFQVYRKGRIIVRGKLVTRGQGKPADCILCHKANIPIAPIEAKDIGCLLHDKIGCAAEDIYRTGVHVSEALFRIRPISIGREENFNVRAKYPHVLQVTWPDLPGFLFDRHQKWHRPTHKAFGNSVADDAQRFH